MSENTLKRRRLAVDLDEKTWDWLTGRAKKNWRSRTKEMGLIVSNLAGSERSPGKSHKKVVLKMEKNSRTTKSEMRSYTHLASPTDDEKTLCGTKRRFETHVVNRWCIDEVVCQKCLAIFRQDIAVCSVHLASLDEEGETLCGEKIRAGTSVVNRWCLAEVTCDKCRSTLKPRTALIDGAVTRIVVEEDKMPRPKKRGQHKRQEPASWGKLQIAGNPLHLASFDVQGETLCGEPVGHPAVTLVSRIKYMHHRFNRDKVCQICRDSLTDTS